MEIKKEIEGKKRKFTDFLHAKNHLKSASSQLQNRTDCMSRSFHVVKLAEKKTRSTKKNREQPMFVEQNEFRGWSMLTINYARTLDVLLMANAAFFSTSHHLGVCVCMSIILLYLFNYLLDDWSFCGSFPLIVLMRIPHVLNVRSQKKNRNKTEFKEKNQRHFGE